MTRLRIENSLWSGCSWYDSFIGSLCESAADQNIQMQAAGSPPADLVGDVNAAQEAIGDIDTGCPQQ